MDLETYIMFLEASMEESRMVLDENLGWVFYPCENAIEEGLNRSMAWICFVVDVVIHLKSVTTAKNVVI